MGMSIISGVTTVSINGAPYAVTDSAIKFSMATINREPVVGKNGSVKYKETPVAAKLSMTILVDDTVDVSTFNSMTDANVFVQLATGATLNAPNFATSGDCSYDSGEGQIELEFFGSAIAVTLGR